MSKPMTDPTTAPLPPVVKTIEVPCSTERAFELFTRGIGEWWPLPTHSVYGDEARSIQLGDGVGAAIIETSTSGEESVWGTITIWEPGRELGFTWHPGVDEAESTDVTVRFTATDRGTRVELEHRGWERRRDAMAIRSSYEQGWVPVLDRFAVRAARDLPGASAR
jgi:Activator of Hsp90 ATPase homolog 1-like protein